MNKFFLITLSYLLLLGHFTPAIASTETSNEYMETYINEEKHFSIEYPSDWSKVVGMPRLDLFLFVPVKEGLLPGANMSVSAENVGEAVTLEQAYSESVTDLSEFLANLSNQNTSIESGEIDLNGIPGKWILHTFSMGAEIQVLQYLVVAKSTKYVITFCANSNDFSNYSLEFEKIIHSFRVL